MSRTCPRCHVDCDVHASGGVEVDLCPRCGGVYLDASEFDTLIAERFVGAKLESTFAFLGQEVDDPLGCSGCGAAMHRLDYDEVEIDQCPDCGGIWLDGHERRDFAARAVAAQRAPEVDATVECDGCGVVTRQRYCIRRLDHFYCEDCVVAGNHPGPEAALVGTKDQVVEAAKAFARAKSDQAETRNRTADRKELSKLRYGYRGRIAADHALFESAMRGVSALFDKFRR